MTETDDTFVLDTANEEEALAAIGACVSTYTSSLDHLDTAVEVLDGCAQLIEDRNGLPLPEAREVVAGNAGPLVAMLLARGALTAPDAAVRAYGALTRTVALRTPTPQQFDALALVHATEHLTPFEQRNAMHGRVATRSFEALRRRGLVTRAPAGGPKHPEHWHTTEHGAAVLIARLPSVVRETRESEGFALLIDSRQGPTFRRVADSSPAAVIEAARLIVYSDPDVTRVCVINLSSSQVVELRLTTE